LIYPTNRKTVFFNAPPASLHGGIHILNNIVNGSTYKGETALPCINKNQF